MLIKFAIDPTALAPSAGPLWQAKEVHERCIRQSLRFGILIYAGAEFGKSDIWEAVEKLPQQLKTLWQIAAKKLRTRKGPDGWLGMGQTNSLEAIHKLCNEIQVVCLEEVGAMLAGLPENETAFRIPPDGPEIVRLSSIDHATSFRNAETASGQPIAEGMKVTELWKNRFSDVATASRCVSIVDRYSVRNLQFAAANNRTDHLGLSRLLKDIDGTPVRKKVSIFAAVKDYSARDLESAVRSIPLGRGGVREIEVFLIPDHHFGQESHDRFLRFDDDVFEIGSGVEVFDGSVVRRQSTCSFKKIDRLHHNTEKKLSQNKEVSFRYSPQR